MNQLETEALSRAINGVPRPIYFRGEQIGEWRDYDERLAMFLLRYRRPARFGGWIDGREPAIPAEVLIPTDEPLLPEDDSSGRLEWFCDEIAELEARRLEPEREERNDPLRAEGA
jgi:hypothetical protein